MDSSESSERQLSNNKEKLDTTPSKQSDSDYAYEDDFEELDSFIQEKSRDSSSSNSTSVTPSTVSSNSYCLIGLFCFSLGPIFLKYICLYT